LTDRAATRFLDFANESLVELRKRMKAELRASIEQDGNADQSCRV